MPQMNPNNKSFRISNIFLLQGSFIILKLSGAVNWNWFEVFIPMFLIGIVIVIAFVIALIEYFIKG